MSGPSLPQSGEVIAEKYRIEEPLGEGGMAVVFAAHHLLLDKPIALKILSPELPRLPQLRERFLTEARAAARVDSPHVARVMDVGTLDSGLPYMVLERLEGCDLGELLEVEGKLPIGDAVDYVLQALQGLAHAHTLGVVHRDLKPANLFLAHQTDGSAIIKILDFGIAKLATSGTEDERPSRATQQGQAVGTPMYMSPEHVRNEKFVDHRTDIWAMGVVLYELLTGQTPFEADGIGETFGAVLNRLPTSARASRPEIPDPLDDAILKCLRQDPDDRFQDVAQFARAIGPYGTGACSAMVDSIEQTLRQRLRRYSGKAIMVRPQTSSSLSVTVEAPVPEKIAAPPKAKVNAPTFDASVVSPLVTPIPSYFPGLRPRYGRWVFAVAFVIGAPLAYLFFVVGTTPLAAFNKLAAAASPAAAASSSSDVLAASASASASLSASTNAVSAGGAAPVASSLHAKVGSPHKATRPIRLH
ncbi:MAG: serine/threonine-protein kinase [Polyangiaceae bacterium]